MVSIERFLGGKCFEIFAVTNRGKCLVREFLEDLQERDQKRVAVLLQKTADYGPPKNREKFRAIKNTNLWEFKSYQVRIFCVFDKERIIILTHGFIKKSARTPKKEIEKAERLAKAALRGKRDED